MITARKMFVSCIAVITVFAGCDQPARQPSTASRAQDPHQHKIVLPDEKLIEGEWVLLQQVTDGKEDTKEIGNKMFFENGLIADRYSPEGWETSYILDEKKQPKQIDLRVKGAEQLIYGIYELQGDTLKLCLSLSSRPTAFHSPPGQNVRYGVLRRVRHSSAPH